MDDSTTESDVALDTVAALDMYAGAFGSEGTTIEAVDTTDDARTVRVTLSDGAVYELRVRQVVTDV